MKKVRRESDLGTNKSMTKRATFVVLVFLSLCFLSVVISLINIMLINGEDYYRKALDQQTRPTTLPAERGAIYDRNMEPLAQSITVYTVYIAPQNMNDEKKEACAEGLPQILDVDKEKVLAACEKNTYYEIVKQQVDEETAEKVRAFILEKELGDSVGLSVSTKRYYPNGNFASTVLGFTGTENTGLYGLESYYNTYLAGTDGRIVAIKNGVGASMPFTYEKIVEATDGYDLVLTIDEGIQYFVEKHLESAMEENKVANRGTCIAMDPNTGEILAMATKGDFDPNEPLTIADEALAEEIEQITDETERLTKKGEAQQRQWGNKAVSETYAPGSVFKIFTGAAAYEEGLVNENSSFSCPGYIVVAGTKIRCHKDGGHGGVNLVDAYVGSCNPAFISIGLRLGADNFFKYFEAFGFTEKTGIDLPGEPSSIYFSADELTQVRLASESFGQTIGVTPIQMITAVSAIANGGNLVQPYIVKQIIDKDGNIIENKETTVKRQVVSEQTAEAIRNMLNEVIHSGSGRNASIAGYEIAGKTGTSEKIDASGATGKDIASFSAMAPADDPKIVMLLVLDEPNGSSTFGGVIASPVVGAMLEEILPYMGIEPEYTEEELAKLDVATPKVTGATVEEAKEALSAKDLSVNIVGEGNTVVKQVPEGGVSIPRGGTVVLYTEEEEERQVTVPDFSNMGLSEANQTAIDYGLNVTFSGTYDIAGAYAYKQSIEAGEKVDKGTVVTVYFRYNDNVE